MYKAISVLTLAATVLTAGLAHAAKEEPKASAKPEAKPAAAAPATKHAAAAHAVAKPSKKAAHVKPATAKKAETGKKEAAPHSTSEKK